MRVIIIVETNPDGTLTITTGGDGEHGSPAARVARQLAHQAELLLEPFPGEITNQGR